jgi:hypothetical protein
MSDDYELHITVTPLDPRLYPDFTGMANAMGWKTSMFDHDEVDDIAGKWFMTTHAADRMRASDKLCAMVAFLRPSFTVERAKIEHIVFDTKRGDTFEEMING